MLIECGECGAPLDADSGSVVVKCGYCGRSNRVAKTRTLAAVTPQDWRPPQVWVAHLGGVERQLALQQRSRQRAGRGLVVGLLIASVTMVALVGGFVFAMLQPSGPGVLPSGGQPGSPIAFPDMPGMPSVPVPGLGGLGGWSGAQPFRCGGNEEVSLVGVNATLPDQVAITVSGNCRLTLTGANITAAEAIVAEGNGEVRVMGSTLRTTGTAIRLSGNKRLQLTGSTIEAGGLAIEARDNAEVSMLGGSLRGCPTALSIAGGARRQVTGAQLLDCP